MTSISSFGVLIIMTSPIKSNLPYPLRNEGGIFVAIRVGLVDKIKRRNAIREDD